MNIGIIGAGNIASTLANTINKIEDANCYGIASRDITKAKEFAGKYNIPKAYGSYEEMVMDDNIELVYIATPHSHHYEHMKLCIQHGKHVLCEKAFTINSVQAREIFDLAREKNVLVTEAIWTRYMPSRNIINEVISSGIIGDIKTVTANLSYNISDKERLINPELAGGALLDVGVYTINFALMHMGSNISQINSTVVMTDTNVDGQDSITILYDDNRMAVLNSGIYGLSDRQGIFYGDKGYIIVDNINNPLMLDVYDSSRQVVKHIDMPTQISGYEYQIIETIKCIREGKLECTSMPHNDTLEVLDIMDGLRRSWNMKYPME